MLKDAESYVSIPCLAGHFLSRNRSQGSFFPASWVSIPCLAGHFLSPYRYSWPRGESVLKCLNPLFSGAFPLTRRSIRPTRKWRANVSIPCLAGHFLSPSEEARFANHKPDVSIPCLAGHFLSLPPGTRPRSSIGFWVSIPCLAGHFLSLERSENLDAVIYGSQSPV